MSDQQAPGAPGIPARWTSSAKSGVGTALNPSSRVWFTLSHGIFNEIYYPRVDQACTRDLGLIVTDGKDFFSEEKRQTDQKIEYLEDGVPAYRLVNSCMEGRYRIEKEIVSDPKRDTVIQHTRFIPTKGNLSDYHVYALLAPHLGNQGEHNDAWIGDYNGTPMLFAERDGNALAMACSSGWVKRSVGYVGTSDGWQDLNEHKLLTRQYDEARGGNVALTGEVDLSASQGEFTIVVGFGQNPAEAGFRALASLQDGFDEARKTYASGWQSWQKRLPTMGDTRPRDKDLFRTSMAVLEIHEAVRFPGGIIASLSIPWGFEKGDDDLGGYHLVWPRDLAETAGGLLAAHAHDDVRRVLHYLQVTQDANGQWPQNMWLDGRPYWSGIQMDETAFPVLLVDMARREGMLKKAELERFWPMVRKAAAFLLRNGPVTQEDRWEEDPGYSPFTLAVEISALLAAADLAKERGEKEIARYLQETADSWNENIERWIYVQDTDLAKKEGVEGYYVRIAPPDTAEGASPASGYVPIKNRPPGQTNQPAANIVSPDALALVRFGLRRADDPRIVNTVKVIDALLKVETPTGPAWHRYNEDGYGEKEDGSPFDGTGIGRAWPLLTGERAHYELAAGNRAEAERLLQVMESFSNDGGLLPEQIWDQEDIPEKELFFGKPSGSAMPLVWAHAEYVKLRRSIKDGRVFDMPNQTVQRYIQDQIKANFMPWRFNHKIQSIPKGKKLRIELLAPAKIHWSTDQWTKVNDTQPQPTGLGLYYADLPLDKLKIGEEVVFTFYWTEEDRWEDRNYSVKVVGSEGEI
jgi:glucoamylase